LPPLQLKGNDAILGQMDAWFKAYSVGPGYEVDDLSVDVSGELAYAAFVYHVSGTLKSGSDVDMWVRATLIYRLVGGEWMIVHDHESVPFDAETGNALTDLTPG
jgi:ketosteroid isomerase-like protein